MRKPTDTERLIALAELLGEVVLGGEGHHWLQIGCWELRVGDVRVDIIMPPGVRLCRYYSTNDTHAKRSVDDIAGERSPATALRAVLDDVIDRSPRIQGRMEELVQESIEDEAFTE